MMNESPTPYITQMLNELVFLIKDVEQNASLYKKAELNGLKVRAEQLISVIDVNLRNDNFFDA